MGPGPAGARPGVPCPGAGPKLRGAFGPGPAASEPAGRSGPCGVGLSKRSPSGRVGADGRSGPLISGFGARCTPWRGARDSSARGVTVSFGWPGWVCCWTGGFGGGGGAGGGAASCGKTFAAGVHSGRPCRHTRSVGLKWPNSTILRSSRSETGPTCLPSRARYHSIVCSCSDMRPLLTLSCRHAASTDACSVSVDRMSRSVSHHRSKWPIRSMDAILRTTQNR